MLATNSASGALRTRILKPGGLLAVAGRLRVSLRMCFRLGSARSSPVPKPGAPARTVWSAVKSFCYVKTVTDLDKYKGKLKGKIVLFSQARQVDPLFDPPAHRQTDEELLRLANAPPPGEPRSFRFTPDQRLTEELNYRKWQLIQDEGAAVVMQPSYRDAGTVYVTSATVPYPPDVPFEKRAHAWDLSKPVVTPQVNVAAEQYNGIVRLVMRGIPVQLEVNIAARFSDEDP